MLEQSRTHALSLAANDEASIEDLAGAVGQDVALTVAVLSRAATHGEAARDVVTAVRVLGIAGVRDAIEDRQTFDFFAAPRGLPPQELVLHSSAARRAAARIAARAHIDWVDELLTAAVLHDVGKIALAAMHPDYPHGVHRGARTPEERVACERRRLGTDHAEVGAAIAHRWGLAHAVIEGIAHHHSTSTGEPGALIRLADLVANYQRGQVVDPGRLLQASLAAGLGRDALGELLYDLTQPVGSNRSADSCPLTARELEVIAGLAGGSVYKQIAMQLDVSVSTVRNHLHNAYRKLGAADRTQAVLIAGSRGWL